MQMQPQAQTAGELAEGNVPRAAADDRADGVRGELIGRHFEFAADLAVLEGARLIGVVTLERLLSARPDTPARDLVEGTTPTVGAEADQELVAWQAARAHRRTVAVVDADGLFLGLVPPERLIAAVAEEHEEDLARLGGFLAATRRARSAAEEDVPRRLWHRVPWLVIGLAGAMASAAIVGSFEEQLRAEVLLALFVPAVVYMADAVGTQTETVVIRGMSVGVPLRDIVVRELATGLVIGALVAACFFPFAFVVWNDSSIAAAVSLALFVSCSIATVVAMALPYLLSRLGRDPAFGSGPLATVIQDLLSILVYFAIAVALLP
jgi:magnesium transporter